MSQYADTVKTIAEHQIAPPPGSAPATPATIPLNFFDIMWLLCPPISRVFFYNLPISTPHFHKSIIPNLISSLSLTLRHFYPFAGRLVSLPFPETPHILFSDGDSVPFTVAESTADFNQIISDGPNDVELLHPLLPNLPAAANLLALKVTLLPEAGVCIGIEFRHVAADGMAFNHFVKSWASIAKSAGGGDSSWVENFRPPILDRGIVKDRRNLRELFLEHCSKIPAATWDETLARRLGKVRATFVVDGEVISRLKKRLAGGEVTASAFVVTSAFVWISLTKSKAAAADGGGDEVDSFIFPADCRGRLDPQIPATYFGNCLSGVKVSVRRRDLLGADGFAVAAAEIAAQIKAMEKGGPLRDLENWFSAHKEMHALGRVVSVAGSPKLRVYETDFGWGRPVKSEPVHIDSSGSVYFSDRRDVDRGGIEFGLSLSKVEMDLFLAEFERRLMLLRQG